MVDFGDLEKKLEKIDEKFNTTLEDKKSTVLDNLKSSYDHTLGLAKGKKKYKGLISENKDFAQDLVSEFIMKYLENEHKVEHEHLKDAIKGMNSEDKYRTLSNMFNDKVGVGGRDDAGIANILGALETDKTKTIQHLLNELGGKIVEYRDSAALTHANYEIEKDLKNINREQMIHYTKHLAHKNDYDDIKGRFHINLLSGNDSQNAYHAVQAIRSGDNRLTQRIGLRKLNQGEKSSLSSYVQNYAKAQEEKKK